MRILFIPIILFANVLSLLASSNMPVEIEVNQTKYVVADSLNSFVFLSLRNTSGEDFIFWTTSRVYTNESQEKKTHDFFYGRNCPECWPLLHILYEMGRVPQLVWKQNFIKMLPKNQKFTIIITGAENLNDEIWKERLKKEIVFEKSSIIEYYGLQNYNLLYPYDFIVVDAENF